MSNLVLCKRCEKIEKAGGKRDNVFYKDGEQCKQCKDERIKKININDYLITLNQIRKIYGK